MFVLCVLVAVNVALRRPAVQSSTYTTAVASRAVDNNLTSEACTLNWSHTEPWFSIDLGTAMDVGRVCVVNDKNYANGQHLQLLSVNQTNFVTSAVA